MIVPSIVLQAFRKPLMAATSTVSTKRCKRQGEDNDHWPVLIVSRCWAVFAGLLAAGQAVFLLDRNIPVPMLSLKSLTWSRRLV